jgi:hypothetical protein
MADLGLENEDNMVGEEMKERGMRQQDRRVRRRWTARSKVISACLVASICGALAAAPQASAAYEQVGTFGGTLAPPTTPGTFPEEAQLGGASAVAINYSGAGGVEAGTTYVATDVSFKAQVIRFDSEGNFQLAWTENARCGAPEGLTPCVSHASGGSGSIAVAVDQTTGNVYVYSGERFGNGEKVIDIYSPDGATHIASFGERTSQGVAATPEKVHLGVAGTSAMTVDDSGRVYLFDLDDNEHKFRLMVFEPETAGNYEHYVWAGPGSDIDAGVEEPGKESRQPRHPEFDDAGHLYIAGERFISELDMSQPGTPVICTLFVKDGGLTSKAVNSVNGEVVFYDYKDRKIHRLNACSGGTFAETATLAPSPTRGKMEALAINPLAKWKAQAQREPGVLYGATAEPASPGGGEPGQSALGYIFAEALITEAPTIQKQEASQIGVNFAKLTASINPRGAQTSYVFEYLTADEYEANLPTERFAGAAKVPAGGAPLGTGTVALPVSSPLAGLSAGTEYYFRVLATNALGSTPGEDRIFRTFSALSALVADHRAYEMVSPAEKDGGEVFPMSAARNTCPPPGECKPSGQAISPQQSSPDGEAVLFAGSSFSFGSGSVQEDQYISRRASNGWQTTLLMPQKFESGSQRGYVAFTESLAEGLLYQGVQALSADAPSGYSNLYAQSTGNPGVFQPLLGVTRHERPEGPSFKLAFAGASRDFSRVFFEANDALTEADAGIAPAAEDGGSLKNNLYEWHDGQIHLVNVLPGNSQAPVGSAFGRADLVNAISADGSRAIWSTENGQVYVRVDGQETEEIADSGEYLSASVSGDRVLLDDGCLYLVAESRCEDLTEGHGGFQGVVGQNEALSVVYFVDTKALTGQNAEGKVPNEGGLEENNLYVWSGGTLKFITTFASADKGPQQTTAYAWASPPTVRTAQVSTSGQWVAFESVGQLTGYDNSGPCANQPGQTAPCTEIFVYDLATEALGCASCNPTNERPIGSSVLPMMSLQNSVPAVSWLPQPRYLLNSGRLFFDSRDSLAPSDTNGGVEDVYEFEPQGGPSSCPFSTGCLSLISAGTGPVDSNFQSTDESGSDVFFTARDQLVARDQDDLIDLYDAREFGGIAGQVESQQSECSGEACQAVQAVPKEAAPASSSGGASESSSVKPCKKGEIRRGNHCQRKPKKKVKHKPHNRHGKSRTKRGAK